MRPSLLIGIVVSLFVSCPCRAQLDISTNNSAASLAQKLVGDGVIISNATLTNNTIATGIFINHGGTNLGMDSGIVLTNGRAKTDFATNQMGLDGNGTFQASLRRADANLGLIGDADLANELLLPVSQLNDAIALEFDFIPLGDSIKFNYVLSSEEYTPATVCVFYDAFAFFISGPGITGKKNIALVPGTTVPVTIMNVNDIRAATCINNPQYYRDNTSNVYFTHEGHTAVFTATAEVQPCQTYHLKLVIADKGDHAWDTGVFLEAGSLKSDPIKLVGNTPLNDLNLPYLAEGCVSGILNITRSSKKPYPLSIGLTFAGTAVNGVDVSPIPPSVIIPANDSVVSIPVSALADFIDEAHEILKIYVSNGCSGLFTDSLEIELRDIDLLSITPLDSTRICRNGAVQLDAAAGYSNYIWTNSQTLSSGGINDPIATPGNAATNYICTATIGNCTARDSVLVKWKTISLSSKTDIPCTNGTTGSISIEGTGWGNSISYAINNGLFQPANVFNGLTSGTHWVKMKDATGCTDSIQVDLVQTFPDINISANPLPASCSIVPDGQIEVLASGGDGSFSYSLNDASYQVNSTLIVPEGTYTVYVKDGNGCISSIPQIAVPKINSVTVDAEPDHNICEGTNYTIHAVSNASDINWFPTTELTDIASLTPTTHSTNTIKYYVMAAAGTCTRTDSIVINVWPAPTAEAGTDIPICYGISAKLNGSGGTDYHWTSDPTFISPTDLSDPVVKPAVTTTYYLNVSDSHGCNSLQPGSVKVIVTPSVKIFAGRDTLIAINQPLQLKAIETNNSGVTIWEWSQPAFLNDPFIADPVAKFPLPVTTPPYEYIYRVTGTTPAGCQGFDDIKIKVYKGPEIYVPTAFTPNNDGKNDVLFAVPAGIKELKSFSIFNRWGQMIFSTQNPSRGWDGKIAGSEQATGMYIWTAEGIDYTGKIITRTGTTILIR